MLHVAFLRVVLKYSPVFSTPVQLYVATQLVSKYQRFLNYLWAYVRNDGQTIGQLDPLSEPATANFVPSDDIQFGYHNASGEQMRITNDGLGADSMQDNDVAYGAPPLKGKQN